MTAALIAKLESASEGSRELDAEVCDATNPVDSGPYTHTPSMYRAFGYDMRVTQSVDAALALAERVLPGLGAWDVGYAYNAEPVHYARFVVVRVGNPEIICRAATPALAICAALLRASAAEGAGHG